MLVPAWPVDVVLLSRGRRLGQSQLSFDMCPGNDQGRPSLLTEGALIQSVLKHLSLLLVGDTRPVVVATLIDVQSHCC